LNDLEGKHFKEVIADEYENNVESVFNRIIGGGASATVEAVLETKSGMRKTYEVRGELIRKGGKSRVVAVLVDTTEKKRMWERLNELQKKGGKK
jgi:PAS domain S-box-containing protein